MGLTRSSSGLIAFDHFTSDTLAAYTKNGDWAWDESSNIYWVTAVDSFARDAAISTCACATARLKESMVVNSYGRVICAGSGTRSYQPRGYSCTTSGNAANYSMQKITADAVSNLATKNNSAVSRTNGEYFLLRVYCTGSVVVARWGLTAFADSVSANDSDFSAGHVGIGGWYRSDYDWLEGRTAHTITCTGMTEGHYLRVTDGTTAAEAAADGAGLATVDAGAVLFPLATVQIRTAAAGGGDLIAELTTTDYADMGGGDAFAYSASGLWLPQLIKPQYFPQFGGLTYG